jgi:hypothetical protein
MRFPSFPSIHACGLATGVFLIAVPLHAQPIELKITPKGNAAGERPLPPGASPLVIIELRNTGRKALGPVELSIRLDGIAPGKMEGWQQQGETLRTTIKSVPAGGDVDRSLRLRVEKAAKEEAAARVLADARGPDGTSVAAAATVRVRDCAGAYRLRLAELRETLSTPVRDAAEAMRRGDATLPVGRRFPYAGRRNNELGRVERAADPFVAHRGSDAQMGTEWFRFMIQRWGSELNAYASQPANPGLCANNYYQIAGYRQGLLPITKHIDATQAAAEKALELARKESGEGGSVDEIARALAKAIGVEVSDDASAFTVLAELRATSNGRRLEPAQVEKLSVVETAAWLADADRRGQQLVQAIELVLATIASAHKETCVCAF